MDELRATASPDGQSISFRCTVNRPAPRPVTLAISQTRIVYLRCYVSQTFVPGYRFQLNYSVEYQSIASIPLDTPPAAP